MASIAPTPTSSYRGRLAPSPTGYLHVGHARTFWAAWQRSREAGGSLVMRMEDLDPERCKSVYAEAALEDLRWLGMRWIEGPDRGGPFGPYVQSKRQSHYLAAWRKLMRLDTLFACRCSRKDLAAALAAPHESSAHSDKNEPLDDEPVYPGTCRHRIGHLPQLPGANNLDDDDEKPDGMNWRFRVPDGEVIEFIDANLGPQRFVAGKDFGDFLVWRRDGVPSYQLACVVDDAAMKITEVVRGADLLKSTARQILLYRALGLQPPSFYHCRLVVDHNGRRLAKRHDALSLRTLRQQGLTPMNILSAELPTEA
ncbi:tRNA glutamyl-Q(34) synthetase GluQRS [Telmatobacter bradus]|uniref:tRNA glutamyl-Q(34) synthetase GluQRS n=1 Tax=Telmatobacter bradus TaxID=474953 RepID=UPI003B433CD0